MLKGRHQTSRDKDVELSRFPAVTTGWRGDIRRQSEPAPKTWNGKTSIQDDKAIPLLGLVPSQHFLQHIYCRNIHESVSVPCATVMIFLNASVVWKDFPDTVI